MSGFKMINKITILAIQSYIEKVYSYK